MQAVLAELRAAGFAPDYRLLRTANEANFEFGLSTDRFPFLGLQIDRENLPYRRDGYVAWLTLQLAPNTGPIPFRVDRIGRSVGGVASTLMPQVDPARLVQLAMDGVERYRKLELAQTSAINK
jgi:hypothetical protein